ncbi:MAG: hypothetical protein GY756_06130 [bacterium]|nr:hypothetical protein [bacterium]
MIKIIITIILIFKGLICFSQDLELLISDSFYKKIAAKAYSEISKCKPDTSYGYIHIHTLGGPHKHIRIINLHRKGIWISFKPGSKTNNYKDITSVYIDDRQNVMLSNFFNTKYDIEDLEKYKDIFKRRAKRKKLSLFTRKVIVHLKKKKGTYIIKTIKFKVTNQCVN